MSTREQLLDAALQTFNADPTASLATVADAAGVGRATLHRHFSTREDLVRELGRRSLDRWEETQTAVDLTAATEGGDAASIEGCLHAMFTALVTDAVDYGFALTDGFLVADPELAARTAELEAREVDFWRAAQAAGVVRRELPARWLVHAGYGILVASRDALRAGDVAQRDLVELVLATLLTGIGPTCPDAHPTQGTTHETTRATTRGGDR